MERIMYDGKLDVYYEVERGDIRNTDKKASSMYDGYVREKTIRNKEKVK